MEPLSISSSPAAEVNPATTTTPLVSASQTASKPVSAKNDTINLKILVAILGIISFLLGGAFLFMLLQASNTQKKVDDLERVVADLEADDTKDADDLPAPNQPPVMPPAANDDPKPTSPTPPAATLPVAPDFDVQFSSWLTYEMKAKSIYKASQIRYPNTWEAKEMSFGDDGGTTIWDQLAKKGANWHTIDISRNAKSTGGTDSCKNINKSTGKLEWHYLLMSQTPQQKVEIREFTIINSRYGEMYIFFPYVYQDYVAYAVCDAQGDMNTDFGSIRGYLPKNYSQADVAEVSKIISSLKLK